MIGETIYQYKILEKLGSGGMGEVYLAEDTRLNRKVALKFLPVHFSSDKALNTRFITEAQAAAKLNHPHIITIFEVNEYDGRPFFAMEYVEGKPLSEIIREGELQPDRAVDITLQICEGLKEAHKKGIIHRDIKPSNIIIDENGRCRILDFGLAAVQSEERLTRTGSLLGTVEYMSPEQVRGEAVDHRSDIFSLGIIFYEAMTGQLPFKGTHMAGTVYSIINESPEPLASHKPEIPDIYQTIIDKAMEKNPDLRYQDATDLQADLNKLKAGRETILMHQSFTSAIKIKRMLIPASAIFVIVLLFLLFKPWRILIEPDQQAIAAQNRLAVMYFDNLADPGDSQKFGEIAANLLITDLSESQFLQVISSQSLYDIFKKLENESISRINNDVALKIAREARSKWMVQGSILQMEPDFILTSQLIDVVTGNIVSSQKIRGDKNENIFALVDRLTIELKHDLPLPSDAAYEPDPSVADITTNSIEAFRFYVKGLDNFHNVQAEKAKVDFLKAVEIDSTFAMAYIALSRLWWNSDEKETRKWVSEALKYVNKTTQKERHYIRAREQQLGGNIPQAIAELQEILERYPDEKEAYNTLGEIYLYDLYQLDKALGYFNKTIALDKDHLWAHCNLAYTYAFMNDFERSIREMEAYIVLSPDKPNPYDSMGDIYAWHGQLDKAIEYYITALNKDPDFHDSRQKLGHMYLFKREYALAESCYRQLCSAAGKNIRSLGRTYLAYISLYQGKMDEAERILSLSIDVDKMEGAETSESGLSHFLSSCIDAEERNYDMALKELGYASKNPYRFFAWNPVYYRYYYIQLLANSGKVDYAASAAESLRVDIEKINPTLISSYWYGLGCIEFSNGNFDKAVNLFEDAAKSERNNRELDGYFRTYYMLARSYLESGRFKDAISEFEKLQSFYSRGRLFWIIWSVKTHYYLGIAHEKSGQKIKAIEQYEEFLDIWKDADPGIEEMEAARARLAKLKQEI